MVPITHEQTIICSKTRLDGTTHEQTIICGQLFAGHVVGCRPMEGKKKLYRMIRPIIFILQRSYLQLFLLAWYRRIFLQVAFYFYECLWVNVQTSTVTVEGVHRYCPQHIFVHKFSLSIIFFIRSLLQCDICTSSEIICDVVFILT